MKKLSLLATLILSASLQTACDDDSSSDNIVVEPAPPSPTLTEPNLATPAVEIKLVGNTFSSPCLSVGVLDLTSSNRLVAFEDSGDFQKKEDFFLGDSCGDSPYLTLETEGTFVDGGKSSPDQPTATIDFAVADTFLTIHNESLQITFNANSYCGKSDWALGERVSISAISCDFFPSKVGTTVADVYTIEEGALYFGNTFSFDSQAGAVRPTDVDRDISFRIPSI